jgi:predicted acyltransferase
MIFVNNPGRRDSMPSPFVHSTWNGLRVADLVFPMFLVAVGLSMPLSGRGDNPRLAVRRVGLLVLVGCVLVSVKYRHPAPSTGILQFIAGAYLLAWLVRRWFHPRLRLVYSVLVLSAVWLAFTGTGWEPLTNAAARVDKVLIGSASDQGIIGMISASVLVLAAAELGQRLKDLAPEKRARFATRVGLLTLPPALVWALAVPVNKRLWTPSYLAVTFALTTLILAGLLLLIDRVPAGGPGRLLVVLGANPFAVYVVTSLAAYTILLPLQDNLVEQFTVTFGATAAALGWAAFVLALGVALCEFLYRKKIFVRV